MAAREQVGFIGLGRMGNPMARNLASKQMAPLVYDLSADAMARVEAVGGRRARDAGDIASKSSIVVTMLPGPPEVEATLLGEGGVIARLAPGALVMDMSTVLPETTDKLAAAAKACGLGFVDAPVGRLAQHAERGESLFMVGASDADFARVKPMLDAMGTTVHHCGGPGAGTRTKLVNNLLAICLCLLDGEALTLTQRFGLNLETTLAVLHGTTATNGQLTINLPSKVLKGDTEPGFAIDLAHKDLSLIVDAANRARVPLPMVAAARESLSLARAGGYGAKDFSAFLDFWCERVGLDKVRVA